MPNYVEFTHKESGDIVNCHQVDNILVNHFGMLDQADPKEWFFDWYGLFAQLLAAGRTIDYIVNLFTTNTKWTEDQKDTVRQIGTALKELFTIDSFYTG
jgi:hypothetical protein